MKSIISSKRTRAIVVIGVIAISIGTISKKIISFPKEGCIKGLEELTLNKEKKFYIASTNLSLKAVN